MRDYVKRISQKANKLSKEQLLKILQDCVEESENLYSIFDSISTGIIIVDNDFHLIQTNSIAESRISISLKQEETKASNYAIWEILEEPEISEYLKKCALKNITNSTEEFSVTTDGGNVRFLSLTLTPLMHKGQLSGRIILIRDITDKKNQEVLLHRMENMANLTNLAAGMAHDIKNPLGAISIHIQLLQKAVEKARNDNNKLPPAKFVENHIDVVNDEINHLNRLVMDFLFAVRPVNAKLVLKNPADLIKNITDFFKPEFNDNNIDVVVTKDDKDEKILLDEKLLREVIMNFSQNSLSAIKKRLEYDKLKGHFQIDCFIKDNKYCIRIADNGCGMSEEVLSKIFDPYFTTKSNGTGLGMTMVYKIIKEFSGEITVDSQENKGSIFMLFFPLRQGEKLALSN